MARLLDFPRDVQIVSARPLSGPRTQGGAATESVKGRVQTVSSPFGLWRWQFVLEPLQGRKLRRVQGFITALNGPANAARIDFSLCRDLSEFYNANALSPWSNGQPFSNGGAWQAAPSLVSVATAAATGESIIRLADAAWANDIDLGDYLGFTPLYLGLHTVTEVIDSRQFRVWPPLRAPLTADSNATIRPVMAMRLESEDSADIEINGVEATSITLTMLELEDADVRDYNAD